MDEAPPLLLSPPLNSSSCLETNSHHVRPSLKERTI